MAAGKSADPLPDIRAGDELWLGRIGISQNIIALTTQAEAEKWVSAGTVNRRIWKVTLSTADEYVLTDPVPPRLVAKGEQ